MGPGQGVTLEKSNQGVGLSGRCGFALLAVAITGLPVALVFHGIGLDVFSAVSLVWLVVSAALIFGDDMTEVTLWKASIKRDAKATRKAREEVEQIQAHLRKIAAVSVENTYIVSGEILLVIDKLAGPENARMVKESPSMVRLMRNMNEVWRLVEPDELKAEEARKKFQKEIGIPA